jgi:hypothetical protein
MIYLTKKVTRVGVFLGAIVYLLWCVKNWNSIASNSFQMLWLGFGVLHLIAYLNFNVPAYLNTEMFDSIRRGPAGVWDRSVIFLRIAIFLFQIVLLGGAIKSGTFPVQQMALSFVYLWAFADWTFLRSRSTSKDENEST